jgi:hypothetical protein
LIVEGVDALPPSPEALKWPAFVDPPGHRDEGPANAKYAEAVMAHGIPAEYSPFVNPAVADRVIRKYFSGVESQALGVEEALRLMQDDVNLELTHAVERDAALGKRYEAAIAKQKRIDEMKASGQRVPPEMIDNPVLRKIAELEDKK